MRKKKVRKDDQFASFSFLLFFLTGGADDDERVEKRSGGCSQRYVECETCFNKVNNGIPKSILKNKISGVPIA